jgi:hypothetical protein
MFRKLIAFLFLLACVWVGVEVYTQGADQTLDDLQSKARGAAAGQESAMKRVQRSASAARDEHLDRIERQLDEGSVGLRDD